MFSKINVKKMLVWCRTIIVIAAVTIIAFVSSVIAASEQKTFSTGENAVNAFVKAVKDNNNVELLTIFGPDANEMIYSGDEVADRNRREMFIKAYDEQHKIEPEGDKLDSYYRQE